MYLILVTQAQVDCRSRYVCTSKARVEGVHTRAPILSVLLVMWPSKMGKDKEQHSRLPHYQYTPDLLMPNGHGIVAWKLEE